MKKKPHEVGRAYYGLNQNEREIKLKTHIESCIQVWFVEKLMLFLVVVDRCSRVSQQNIGLPTKLRIPGHHKICQKMALNRKFN